MKKILISLLCIVAFHPVFCQDNSSSRFQNQNSFQLDLGGHGLFYSVNYERILLNGNKFKTASQLGISYYPAATGIRDIWMPLGVNEILSFGKHHIEAGLGYIVIREATRNLEDNPDDWFWSGLMSGRIGYRYQKSGGRLILRASFTPMIEHGTAHEFHPSGGISIGYSF
jgi:hypothetical protein